MGFSKYIAINYINKEWNWQYKVCVKILITRLVTISKNLNSQFLLMNLFSVMIENCNLVEVILL